MEDIYYAVAHRSQEEIDSFNDRYKRFDTKLIPKIFKDSLSLTVTNWKPSDSWGSSHVIYFVDIAEKPGQLVLRANTGFLKTPETVMLAEKIITEKVSGIGVPTNVVRYVDISRKIYSFDFQIEELLVGQDPETSFKGTCGEYDQISFDLGVAVAKYSQILLEGFGRFNEEKLLIGNLSGTKRNFYDYITVCLDSDLKYLVDRGIIKLKTADEVVKIFNSHRLMINSCKGGLVHHDLADHNLRFVGNRLTGVFDWEAAVSGDVVLDLASCPTWRTIYPREEKLLEGYRSIRDLPQDFKERRDIYRLRTMIWKMVYVLRRNIMTADRYRTFQDSLIPFGLTVTSREF